MEVPRGDIDRDGHHIFMVASPDGRCHLVNKQSGKVYWTVETNGLLHVADRGENVNDYADLKQGDDLSSIYHFQPYMYHFQPKRSLPQLIPFNNVELLEEYFNLHYGEDGTEVTITEKDYVIEYQSGVVNGSFDSARDVIKSKDCLPYFIIKRVDYHLRRSSPLWSLQYASIKAWFPSSCDTESSRVSCVVYHAWDARSFVNVCKDCNLQPSSSGGPLNEIIMDNTALVPEEKDLTLNISEMNETITNNKRIDVDP